VADTAGVRDTKEPIEAEGVRRALAHAKGGMTLLLLDGSADDPRAGLPADMPEPDLMVWNKADLFTRMGEGLSISLKTGQGMAELLKMLQQKVQHKLEGSDSAPPLTRPRHRHALREALNHLQHGLAVPEGHPELLAEDLRLAMRAIGRITGVVDVEEVLDFVFRDFCIGK
jgi:tRNA modification GTPase